MIRAIPIAALAVFIAAGCAGSNAQLRSEKERLEEELSELRAQAREQRRTIRDLENQLALVRDRLGGAARAAGSSSPGADRRVPELPVEVREPDSGPAGGGPQEFAASAEAETSARDRDGERQGENEGEEEEEVVVLSNRGEAGGSRGSQSGDRARASGDSGGGSRSGAGGRPEARPDAPVPTTTERLPEMGGDVPPVSARLEDAGGGGAARGADAAEDGAEEAMREPQEVYERYLNALRAGNHAFAIAGFRNFIDEFPDHPLADNGQYWLAEAYYDQDDYERALEEFRRVVSNFPGGNKVPDALLKIGYSHVKLGDEDAARRALNRVLDRYGDAKPAELAKEKLEELGEP